MSETSRPSQPAETPRSAFADLLTLRAASLAAVGLAAGSSLFLGFGFYDLSVWGWFALAGLAVLAGLVVARPVVPRGPALAAAVGLAGLWLWALASTRWAESADQALLDADRWLLYAVLFCILLALLRERGTDRLLLAAATAPVALAAVYLLGRMATGDGADLFLANRLNEPLEYVNGEAGYLLVALWPAVAVAERARSPLDVGAGLALATALGGLALMTQSRGAVAGLVLAAVIVLAVVPGRTRRGWALLLVAAGVGICVPAFGDVLETLPAGVGSPDGDAIASAARWLIVSSLAVGGVWAAIRAVAAGRADWGRAPSVALVAIALAGLLAASVPPGERADQISEQYEAFSQLEESEGGSRLTSGGGNRRDYWSVAVDQFADDPLRGVGAGNYDTTYFRERETTENVRNPHSIELQALGELGLVGGALLALVIAGAAWGLVSRSRGEDEGGIGLLVASAGMFFAWLGQTSVDWLHLIPGLTAIALCALAVLLRPFAREAAEPLRGRAGRAAIAGAVAAGAALLVAMPLLAESKLSAGQEAIADDPESALERARESLELNDESLPAYQLEAAALARLGDYAGARDALLEATEREPSDYVPWALLGDLAVRRGEIADARRFYGRASELNPRDEALARLAADPASARDQLPDAR